jgi:hypothetical protein
MSGGLTLTNGAVQMEQRGSNLSNQNRKLRKIVALKGSLIPFELDWNRANGVNGQCCHLRLSKSGATKLRLKHLIISSNEPLKSSNCLSHPSAFPSRAESYCSLQVFLYI